MADADNVGLCDFQFMNCFKIVPCESSNYDCKEPNYACVYHLRCYNLPVFYPISMTDEEICPSITRKKKKKE
ncbi:unnamed protein product [Rotaria sp. Silwood2]|nr:unnamed protein product [Rotaria sp. Silwood2]CAF3316877.1 unnamed protein product [Rotaria sp. Silwood2]CAF4185114.1 unnamed protein product [Rotaria sp. Silwood2]CAF4375989.1 unnamed protein product [Rotaria sp. Silwood2]